MVRRFVTAACLSAAFAGQAAAQSAVTTFGATNAQACYRDALDGFEARSDSCDAALDRETLTRKDRSSTHVNRGIIRNRAGELEAALEDFNAALKLDADLAEAFLNRGNTFFLMRNFTAALADYETSLAKGIAKAHVAWYNIGLAQEAFGKSAEARAAFEKALEILPEFEPAKRKLGR